MSVDALTRRPVSHDRESTRAVVPDPGTKSAATLPRMVAPATAPLVPTGGVFEGEVAVLGDTRIEGRIVGRVRGPGSIALGPDASIEGELECDEVDSEGAIRGPIRAGRRVRLAPGARLDGDVESPFVEVADSAVWNGVAHVGEPGPEGEGKG